MNTTSKIKLTPQQKDEYLNQLLLFMKEALEQHGTSAYKNLQFHFQKGLSETDKLVGDTDDCVGEDRVEFLSGCKISDDEFDVVLNFAITHKFVEALFLGNQYGSIVITDDGMARAMSIERATYKPAVTDNTTSIHIGSINGDNVQVGNYNTQNICNTFNYLIDEINKSDASEEEKKTALTKLKDFTSNPIVSGITSGCAVEIIKSLTRMGI